MKHKIRQAKSIEQVFGSAYWHLERGDMSVAQLSEKLNNKTDNSEWIEEVLNSLLERGFLKQDYEFALHYVSRSSLSESFGPKRLRLELKKKKIGEDIVEQVFEEVSINFKARCLEVLQLKYPNGYNGKKKSSIVNFLVNKGFSYSHASSAIDSHGFLDTFLEVSAKKSFSKESRNSDLPKLVLKWFNKNNSHREISGKAYAKGFDREEVNQVIRDLDLNFVDSVINIVDSKLRTKKSSKDIDKLKRQLLSKGFSYDEISTALRELNLG